MARVTASPAVSAVLTTMYLMQCVWSYLVLGDATVGPYRALDVFPLAMVAVMVVLHLSKYAGRSVASMFGANKMNARKFGDQTWQLIIHTSMTFFELQVLEGETWYSNPSDCFKDYNTAPEKTLVQALYLVQLAIWVITCFSHHFLEARHKDYVLMYAHHIVTIALILLSWGFGFQKMGVTVLYVHDASDITIDLLKMFNYLKLEGPSNFFAVEIIFVLNLISWMWWRIYQLPFRIVYKCIVDGFGNLYDVVCLARPFYVVCCCYAFIYLLLALCLMHMWWLYLLLRIAYKLVCSSGKKHDAGREEYEGDSDDEVQEDKDVDEKKID